MTVRPASQIVPVAQRAQAILRELARIVVGKDETLKLALACMIARGHLLIEDIPGVGKSTLAQALVMSLSFTVMRLISGLRRRREMETIVAGPVEAAPDAAGSPGRR